MRLKNLTNSPFALIDKDGKKVMLPARGTVDIEPHPMHAAYYRQVGYFEISEDHGEVHGEDPGPVDVLREKYESLTGEAPDRRWSRRRLLSEIEKAMSDG